MKILKQIQKITELGKSPTEKQRNINVSEVFHLWNHLVQRYNVIQVTNNLEIFARDEDLKLLLGYGRKSLEKHVSLLEKEMINYEIPLPVRNPKQTQATANVETISDRYIYRRVLRGIQSFLPIHTIAFTQSTSPKIRDMFMAFLIDEMKLYDRFLEYGKLKGYVMKPPVYKL